MTLLPPGVSLYYHQRVARVVACIFGCILLRALVCMRTRGIATFVYFAVCVCVCVFFAYALTVARALPFVFGVLRALFAFCPLRFIIRARRHFASTFAYVAFAFCARAALYAHYARASLVCARRRFCVFAMRAFLLRARLRFSRAQRARVRARISLPLSLSLGQVIISSSYMMVDRIVQ